MRKKHPEELGVLLHYTRGASRLYNHTLHVTYCTTGASRPCIYALHITRYTRALRARVIHVTRDFESHLGGGKIEPWGIDISDFEKIDFLAHEPYLAFLAP